MCDRAAPKTAGNFDAVAELRKRENPKLPTDEEIRLALSMIAPERASAAHPDHVRERQDNDVRAIWARLRARWA